MLNYVRCLIKCEVLCKEEEKGGGRWRKWSKEVKMGGEKEETREGKRAKFVTVKFNQFLVFVFVSSISIYNLVIEEAQQFVLISTIIP